MNGEFLASVSDGLQDAVNFKEQKIVDLERENAVLRDQYTLLQLEVRPVPCYRTYFLAYHILSQTKTLSAERIQETPHYKALLDHASRLEATVTENKAYIAKIDDEILQLQNGRKEFEDTVSVRKYLYCLHFILIRIPILLRLLSIKPARTFKEW